MDHSAKLEQLPEGLLFPPRLQDRIHFDPARKQLVWRGFMSKADFDCLFELHEDAEYRRAIERLFQVSAEADGHRLGLSARMWGVLAILGLIVAALAYWQLLYRH